MANIQAQVIIRTADAIPENFVTNTFAFDYTNSQANLDATTDAIKAFYDDINAQCFPDTVAQNGHVVKYYIANGPKPNYPQFEDTFNLTSAPSGDPLPSECAIVLSFQGTRVPGQAQARKQGRIYIGPLDDIVNLDGRPSGTTRGVIGTAAVDFATAIDSNTDGVWGVYSTVNDSVSEITNGWIDDTFDTQRRRGLAVTSKTIWTV